MGLSAFDENNAFTRVETPEWMWAWCSTPPVLAAAVWDLLPEDLRRVIRPHDWVSAQYRRLAMGSTHSVHILMNINITVIGRMLKRSWAWTNRAAEVSTAVPAHPLDPGGEDPCWWISYELERLRRRGSRRLLEAAYGLAHG